MEHFLARKCICSLDFLKFYVVTGIPKKVKVTVFPFFWTTLNIPKEPLRHKTDMFYSSYFIALLFSDSFTVRNMCSLVHCTLYFGIFYSNMFYCRNKINCSRWILEFWYFIIEKYLCCPNLLHFFHCSVDYRIVYQISEAEPVDG